MTTASQPSEPAGSRYTPLPGIEDPSDLKIVVARVAAHMDRSETHIGRAEKLQKRLEKQLGWLITAACVQGIATIAILALLVFGR